jgi:hypothetical protein
VHAPTEDKSNDMKDIFYEETDCVLGKFSKVAHENFVRRFHCKSMDRILYSHQQLGMTQVEVFWVVAGYHRFGGPSHSVNYDPALQSGGETYN